MAYQKAAFFDRDGTLIKEVSYLSSIDDMQLLPEAVAFARLCAAWGYKIFIVTNQSGVARGYFSSEFVEATHVVLAQQLLKEGVVVDKFYYCPHHPTEAVIQSLMVECSCRKPGPGMLHTAATEFNLDLSQSLMFGDRASDVQAGIAAGCRSFDIAHVMSNPLLWETIVSGHVVAGKKNCSEHVEY